MKNLIASILLFGSFNVMAQEGKRVLLQDSKEMSVEVSHQTVRCSMIGYGGVELKINIKGLDSWTLLDHSNLRFGDASPLPCMTAGACKSKIGRGVLGIDDVIQENPRIEKIIVLRKIEESKSLNGENCERSLIETLNTEVGGIKFHHVRSIAAEILPKISCAL